VERKLFEVNKGIG